MAWIEKVHRRLPEMAPERAGAFLRPVHPLHTKHEGAGSLPTWAENFLIELDERLERLESIRASDD